MEFVAPGKIQIGDILKEPTVQALMDRSDGWFCLLDRDGGHLLVSAGVEALTGYPPNEFVRRNHMDNIHVDDVPVMEAAFQALDHGPVEVRMRCMHKDGTPRWVIGRLMLARQGVCVDVQLTDDPHEEASWTHIAPFI